MHPFDYSDKFDNIPVFLASGKEAYSLEPALRFYDSLNGPKDKLIVEGTNHVEFYWKDENGDKAAAAVDDRRTAPGCPSSRSCARAGHA